MRICSITSVACLSPALGHRAGSVAMDSSSMNAAQRDRERHCDRKARARCRILGWSMDFPEARYEMAGAFKPPRPFCQRFLPAISSYYFRISPSEAEFLMS